MISKWLFLGYIKIILKQKLRILLAYDLLERGKNYEELLFRVITLGHKYLP